MNRKEPKENQEEDAQGQEKPKVIEPALWRLKTWFPDLTDTQENKLRGFQQELIRFNGRMNLISPRSERESDSVHFADSIIGGRLVLKNSGAEEVYDLGSGNGLPGLVMAILDSQRKFVLIDKDARKVEFIRHVSSQLGLKNVSAQQKRVEELAPGSISVAVSRAMAPISKALLMTRKSFDSGGAFFFFKGENWVKEIADIPTQLCGHWSPNLVDEYSLPDRASKLAIIMASKT